MITEKEKTRQKNNMLYVAELKKKPTTSEKRIQKLLNEIGIKYIFQKGFLKPFHRIVDFYIPRPYRLIIEVDGKYHEEILHKDNRKDTSFLEERGFKTLRIKNEEAENMTSEHLLTLIKNCR